LAGYAETVVGAASGVLRRFYQDFAGVMRQAGFVLDIPSQGFEERRDEIHTGLRLGITFREVVIVVGFEATDKSFGGGFECREGWMQGPLLVAVRFTGSVEAQGLTCKAGACSCGWRARNPSFGKSTKRQEGGDF
jgi:hypothetical protein